MSNLNVPGGQGNGQMRAVSNPLPGLASLSFNNPRNDAQQQYEAAQASRANVTVHEIEQAGIAPKVNLIERELLRPKSRINRARADSTARKVFSDRVASSRSPSGSSNVNTINLSLRGGYPSNQEQAAAVNSIWEDLGNEGRFNGLNHQQVALLYQHWHQRALAINETAKEWKALTEEPDEPSASKSTFDLFGSLMTDFELLLEVCKHLRPIDIINLYSVSKPFHDRVNANLQSTILRWTDHMAPSSARIFCHQLYYQYFIDDPSGRDPSVHRDIRFFNQPAPNRLVYQHQRGHEQPGPVNPFPPSSPAAADGQQQSNVNIPAPAVRKVPSLIWFQMVVDREIQVRDILAVLARHGHRTPPDTHKTVKKLWLLMDVASCSGRAILIKSKDIFTDEDLYRARLFFIKLYLLFTDPVFGPKTTAMAKLFLGQKSFTPLWQFLRRKKYTTEQELVEMKTRYDVRPTLLQILEGHPINGVPPNEMGMIHVEGWGRGVRHLLRPDEMVSWEVYKRGLALHLRTERMMLYGHVDLNTGKPLVPTLDELYMSDDELDLPADSSWRIMKHRKAHGGCGNVPFERSMWQPKHARKARWNTLTEEEKEEILAAEEEEIKEAKNLRYLEGELDVALADLAEALYDYAVEKEAGAHEERGIDGLEFDSSVSMPEETPPSEDEEDFDDADWEAIAPYMKGLDPLPDHMTILRQEKAYLHLDKSVLMAKEVYDDHAKGDVEKQEQQRFWKYAVDHKLPQYTGSDPACRRTVPVAPRSNSPAAQQAFWNAHQGPAHHPHWLQPVWPEQAERPDVRADYILKAAVALNKARLNTGTLDRVTDAMPDDEVAELEDEEIVKHIEGRVKYGWMLHMPGNQFTNQGQDEDDMSEAEPMEVDMEKMKAVIGDDFVPFDEEPKSAFTSWKPKPDYSDEDDDEEDEDEDEEMSDQQEEHDNEDYRWTGMPTELLGHCQPRPAWADQVQEYIRRMNAANAGPSTLNQATPSTAGPSTVNTNTTMNQPTPSDNNQNHSSNPHNPNIPYPSQMYHYHHDPSNEFNWRGWLDMQHQNDLLSEAARLDPSILNGAHEIGPDELKRRVERTIAEKTAGYKDDRERFLRGYYRQW